MTLSLPSHGGQPRAIAARYNLEEKHLLDFSANIAPNGPPAAVLSALASALQRPEVVTHYPDLEHTELKFAIGRAVSVSMESIAVANGFVSLLEALLRASGIQRCLLPLPAFVEYKRVLAQHGVEVVPWVWQAGKDFSYDLDAILNTATHTGCYAILIANPQNPSGQLTMRSDLQRLVYQAGEHGIHILLDEAFIDYAPEQSLTTLAASVENLTVFRSVTKFYAMPGLRVSYAVSSPTRSTAVERRLAPWPVSTLASIAVCAALEEKDYACTVLNENREARQLLARELETLGHHVYPSAGNFLLIRLNNRLDPETFWERMIREHGMVLRACQNYDGLDARFYRIAVRSHEDNQRLVAAFQKI